MRKILAITLVIGLMLAMVPTAALAGDSHAVSNRWAGAVIGAGVLIAGSILLNALQAPVAAYPAPPTIYSPPPPVVYTPPPVIYTQPPVVPAPPITIYRAPSRVVYVPGRVEGYRSPAIPAYRDRDGRRSDYAGMWDCGQSMDRR